jgi:hypothetical protein
MAKPITEWTDAELREGLRMRSERVQWSSADLIAELDRRTRDRQTRWLIRAAIVSAAAAAIAVILSGAVVLTR